MPDTDIVIAERNQRVGSYLQREFQRRGWCTVLVCDGWALFKALREEPEPRLLVLDPDLPSRHGSGLARRLREEFPDLMVVLHPGDETFPEAGGQAADGRNGASWQGWPVVTKHPDAGVLANVAAGLLSGEAPDSSKSGGGAA